MLRGPSPAVGRSAGSGSSRRGPSPDRARGRDRADRPQRGARISANGRRSTPAPGVRHFLVYDNGCTDATLPILRATLPEAARTVVPWRQLFSDALARAGDPQPGAGLCPCRVELRRRIPLDGLHRRRRVPGAEAGARRIPARWRTRRGAQPVAALAHVRPLGPRRAAGGRGAAELPAAGRRPDERRARRAGVQVRGRPLPPDRRCGCIRWRSTARAAPQRPRRSRSRERDRGKPGFYSAEHLQLNHYYTRSEAELAAKIGRGPNLRRRRPSMSARCGARWRTSRRDEVEDRAALDYLARLGWEPMRTELIVATYENPRALGLCLASVARQAVPPGCDRRRRRRLGGGDQGGGRGVRGGASGRRCATSGTRRRIRKAAILNRAIASSEAEFLIFIDGDVLIHPDFVARHLELARPGPLGLGQPDPARRRGDGGRDRGATWRRGGCSTGAGCARTERSTGSGPG